MIRRSLTITRRHGLVRIAAALGVPAALAAPARAQDGRPFTILVGYPAGGGTDVLARVLGDPLGKLLARPVVIRNVPGAAGQIAASTLLREGADGAAMLAINHPDLSMAVQRNTVGLKAADFHVALVDVQDPRIFLVRSDADFDSLAAFAARAKAQPGKLAISFTAGSAQETFSRWLCERLGLDVTQVGYKGGAEASNALLAGDVHANLGDDFARLNLRSRTKALFVGSRQKSPRWPEAVTLTEALAPLGVKPPTPDFLSRYGIYAVAAAFRAGNPPAYAALQRSLLQARESAEFQDYIARNKLQDLSVGRRGEEFEAAFAADALEIAKIK